MCDTTVSGDRVHCYGTGSASESSHLPVHLKSQFIMNGVCVIWRGWLDLQRLDGAGRLDFDEDRARIEDQLLREQIEQYNQRLREIEDRQRQYQEERERQAEAEAEVVEGLLTLTEGTNRGGGGAGAGPGSGAGGGGQDGACGGVSGVDWL
ncbi:hypothetical protein LSH36_61g04014 [Paralvinella palmiformis]|uniref:Uncharacterized protein n=1 Tax=Paralvinella palmiformis TaxID=53620 RepID=A0AAD9K4J5_9ANNE|nr:hypothetical protein LSH36_61g04014 [Paralvinella palmiformis]